VLVLAILWQATRLTFRPDRQDDLRRVEALFVSGRYYDALSLALALTQREPRFALGWARLGMLRAVRDEQAWANQALGYAIGLGLRGRDYDLVRLYQGHVTTAAGHRDEAARLWAQVGEGAPLYPLRRVLEAEGLLAAQDYAGAEVAYRAALLPALPSDWRVLVHTRLAGLRASSDPAGALAELAQIGALQPPGPQPSLDALAQPLLPAPGPDPHRLAAALHAGPAQQAQLLGQIYLDAGWYALAEAQFADVAPDSPGALAAATYAAYTSWRSGMRAEGQRRLEALVATYPQEPRARALLALVYLADEDAAGARAQLDMVQAMAPRAPDTHLAWAQWYAAHHDYVAAASEYRRALDQALPEERGHYALALARFHLASGLRICELGPPAAEEAARYLTDDTGAWATLAAARFSCGNAAGARTAAERALALAPDNPEAAYYLGRALASLGKRADARQALIEVADLAPASPWRARAETQLATLGL
jgi:tetratricopeptide (TPR) repeat protein